MMVSPDFFREECENLALDKLIEKRNEIIKSINDYENNNIPEDRLYMKPSPKMVYYYNNEYLREITDVIMSKIENK